ncbi:MAG: DUF6184 family natural product biosynthesis lipoprotein [Persicimonas sp.]
MKLSILLTLVGGLLLLGLVGCEKSRADYRDDIAGSVCDQMRDCEAFGPDGEFADYDDCLTEVKSTYNDMWPADECGGGRIDAQAFEQCKSRAVANACDENILDALSFRLECGADDVCTAEPKEK